MAIMFQELRPVVSAQELAPLLINIQVELAKQEIIRKTADFLEFYAGCLVADKIRLQEK